MSGVSSEIHNGLCIFTAFSMILLCLHQVFTYTPHLGLWGQLIVYHVQCAVTLWKNYKSGDNTQTVYSSKIYVLLTTIKCVYYREIKMVIKFRKWSLNMYCTGVPIGLAPLKKNFFNFTPCLHRLQPAQNDKQLVLNGFVVLRCTGSSVDRILHFNGF